MRNFAPTFGFQGPTSEPMNGRYVYYNRLNTDESNDINLRAIYAGAMSSLNRVLTSSADLTSMAAYFSQLAAVETQKEQDLLRSKFHVKLNYGGYEDGELYAKELIDAVNSTMQIRAVYERNRDIIKQTQGQKQIISWFSSEFQKKWDANIETYMNDIINTIFGRGHTIPFNKIESKLKEEINKAVYEMAEDVIFHFFGEAEKESGLNSDFSPEGHKYKDAYKPLLREIKKYQNQDNPLILSLIHSTGLDKIADKLSASISSATNNKAYKENLKHIDKNLSNFLKIKVHSIGGLNAEDLEAYMAPIAITKSFGRSYAHMVMGYQTGATGMKPDCVYAIDVKYNQIDKWLQKNTFGTREKDVAAAEALNKIMEDEFDTKGFLIYSNIKNQGGKNFKGFSAGSDIKLSTFTAMLDAAHLPQHNRKLMVGVAMQAGKGAIGQDHIDDIRMTFARAVAAFLFDDFTVIGQKQIHGAQSIHILDLNGVYTPLSFYLWLIARACEDANTEELNRLVNIQIHAPNILFPTQESQQEWQDKNSATPSMAWIYQSETAYTKTTIEVHFMKNFKKIIESFT